MDERRAELRRTWDEIAKRGRISYRTIQNVRIGRWTTMANTTRWGLEDGLDWTRGSVDVILAGGDPTPIEQAERLVPRPRAESDQLPAGAGATLLAVHEALAGSASAEAKVRSIRQIVCDHDRTDH